MRPLAEIEADIKTASNTSDPDVIERVIDELGRTRSHHGLALRAEARGTLSWLKADYEESLRQYDEARDRYDKAGLQLSVGRMLGNMSMVETEIGRFKEAAARMEQVTRIYEAQGYSEGMPFVLSQRAVIAQSTGDRVAALELFERSFQAAESYNRPVHAARALLNIGNILADVGAFDAAMERYDQARAAFSALGDTRSMLRIENSIGVVYLDLDHYEEALETFLRIEPQCREVGDVRLHEYILGNIGCSLNGLKRYEEAAQYHGQAVQRCREIGDIEGVPFNLANQGHSLADGKFWNDVPAIIDQLHACTITDGLTAINFLFLRARLSWHEGRIDEAVRLLEEAHQRVTTEHLWVAGLRIYRMLRCIAERSGDLESYVRWNTALTDAGDRINDTNGLVRLAIREKERELQRERELRAREHDVLNAAIPVVSNSLDQLRSQISDLDSGINARLASGADAAAVLQWIQRQLGSLKKDIAGENATEMTLEQLNVDFFVALKARHANLTRQEMRVALLVRAGMSTPEIANTLNLSPRSIDTHRLNLRRKMQLTPDQLLADVLRAVST